ncbi:hypothetical protein [Clostridium sp. JN-9]|uniref:hypothetical protein n=1 Tax=Clostridium sp. JN-9 TaxID=2507159 RepID=UPI000FFE2771|nr:hypothetical protein [Clostridium sp. JN-9]QAT39944.1 hypothetical protein EQM05_06600 [Clostridium sp. JN-9]
MATSDKQLESSNLKVIKDQMNYEALLNKKYSECSGKCTDQQLKDLCNEACQIHKQNFSSLKSYLDSHE